MRRSKTLSMSSYELHRRLDRHASEWSGGRYAVIQSRESPTLNFPRVYGARPVRRRRIVRW